jgi:Tol biopolymer transport system component
MNTSGTALTQLTMGIDAWPAVAPNGRQLVAFARDMDPDPAGFQFDIFTMLPNGTLQTDLTPQSPSQEIQPTWSPDATKIAFATNRDGHFEIYKMNAEDESRSRHHRHAQRRLRPRWSPTNPNLLIFVTKNNTAPNALDIWKINADGTGLTNLTQPPQL